MVLAVSVRAVLIWVGIVVLAVVNGVFREAVLVPWTGGVAGLFVSGVLLSALILAVAYVVLPWLSSGRRAELIGIGLGWLVLTLIFEFSFGLLQGKSWPVLVEAYTFKGGNIWPVVLLVTASAPYLAAKCRGRVWRR